MTAACLIGGQLIFGCGSKINSWGYAGFGFPLARAPIWEP